MLDQNSQTLGLQLVQLGLQLYVNVVAVLLQNSVILAPMPKTYVLVALIAEHGQTIS
nr:hypothetical protein HMPREF0276_0978 [Corynebacterium accolens ATCC 49725]